ncbi:flagellar filament capping protein FliD [Pseudomonas luteola]|uniref:Flagellar hook-associated protein 2 n=1 Tax=Pseudomonas luteola TaxID=47886 RepID=A0ABS0MMT8_PSELU|nr:flagellar filament capping protein FliD [Pseudomonas luteola]MBH3437062.1 flagellar filament capping protein FliD [Pseudomonas luteola]
MAGTTVSGIGTGIDTASIVKALVNAEKAPKLNQITTQRTSAQTTLSAVGSLKSALETFKTAMGKINTASSFTGLSANTSNEKAVTVTASDNAVSGTYQVKVDKLATGSKVATAVIADATKEYSAGKLVISQGDGSTGSTDYSVEIAEGSSLQEVRDAINSSLQTKGITANIISDNSGSRLVLSSTTTGSNTDLSVRGSTSELAAFDAGSVIDTNTGTATTKGTVLTQAQDAEYSIDGLAMKSKTNTLDKAISGITLTLGTAGETSTVTVGSNTSSLKSSVKSFVDAYNALISTTSSLTKVSTTTGTDSSTVTASALTGDASVRELLSAVRKELVNSSGQTGEITMLSQLGIMTTQSGKLEINDTKLDAAIAKNPTGLADFFTGDNGLLSRLSEKVDVYTASDGILAKRQTSLQGKLDDLNDQQDALDRRVTKLEATLNAKYNAMDTLVAQLNATSNSVLTTLNALNKQDND